MKEAIHPDYKPAKILCACGNEIVTRSTAGDFHIEICSSCHPFFTGKQKIMDTAGRIERFKNRYAAQPAEKAAPAAKKAAKAEAAKPEPKKAAAPAENRAAKRAKAGKSKKAEPKAEASAPAATEEKPAE